MDARIRILLRIIEERQGTLHMSSEQIGKLVGLGEARILRLFSTEVGKTLRRHLLEVRMARAAHLLKDEALPIKTIAVTCGYTEVSNFYRDFKNVFGTSPMQMRLVQRNARLHDQYRAVRGAPLFSSPQPRGRDASPALRMSVPEASAILSLQSGSD